MRQVVSPKAQAEYTVHFNSVNWLGVEFVGIEWAQGGKFRIPKTAHMDQMVLNAFSNGHKVFIFDDERSLNAWLMGVA